VIRRGTAGRARLHCPAGLVPNRGTARVAGAHVSDAHQEGGRPCLGTDRPAATTSGGSPWAPVRSSAAPTDWNSSPASSSCAVW
jgi:hypothetical protein